MSEFKISSLIDHILSTRLTQRTRTFIRRSMLVLLNVLFPQFCISFVSGPASEPKKNRVKSLYMLFTVSTSFIIRPSPRPWTVPLTSEQHQSEAPLGVPQGAASQQDLLVVQRVLLTGVRQRPREAVEAVVGGFTSHLAFGGGGGGRSRLENDKHSTISAQMWLLQFCKWYHWSQPVFRCRPPGLLWWAEPASPSGWFLWGRWEETRLYICYVYCNSNTKKPDWPVELCCLDVNQVERFTAGEQQEVGLKSNIMFVILNKTNTKAKCVKLYKTVLYIKYYLYITNAVISDNSKIYIYILENTQIKTQAALRSFFFFLKIIKLHIK